MTERCEPGAAEGLKAVKDITAVVGPPVLSPHLLELTRWIADYYLAPIGEVIAAALPGALSYEKRFAAYELSHCEGREREAYEHLRRLYDLGENERLPTLLSRLKDLEIKLDIPLDQRIPDRVP